MKARLFPVAGGLAAILLLAVSGCVAVQPSDKRPVTLAPTAITIPLERVHQDILDSRAPLASVVCLNSKADEQVSVRLQFEPEVTAEVQLLSRTGVLLGQPGTASNGDVFSLRGLAEVGSPSLCVQLRAVKGWGMYTLEWRTF